MLLAVINIWVVSFVVLAGKSRPKGITLYAKFLYFWSKLSTVSSVIWIWIGFNPPTMSKSCCALTIIVSIGNESMLFCLFPSLVIEKSCIFLSSVLTSDPFI